MKLFKNLMFYLSVPKCVFCGERLSRNEKALCSTCFSEYENEKNRNCSLCTKPLSACSCPNHFLDSHFVHKLIKVFRYSANDKLPTSSLIYSLKKDNRSDVLDFLSSELAEAIQNTVQDPQSYIFTSVPRRKKSIAKYGIDHASILSRAVAKKLDADYLALLKSKAKREQKKSKNRQQRIKNADFVLKKQKINLTGKRVIIIDDIVTSGASIGTAAMNIKSTGAKSVTGAVLSIAYKDEKGLIL